MEPTLLFRQLFDTTSSTYTYLLADISGRSQGLPAEAVIIDPVDVQSERDSDTVKELGLSLVYAINTHVHADHITGTAKLRAVFPACKSVIAEAGGARANVHVRPGDLLHFGKYALEVRATPGHTAGCITLVLRTSAGVMAFTGDALLIRGCGRTDFQGGSAEHLYQSVHSQIFTLPEDTLLYPGHDYKGRTCTSVGEEKAHNPRLSKSRDQFVEIMKALNLPKPKLIDVAVPKNFICGADEALEAQLGDAAVAS